MTHDRTGDELLLMLAALANPHRLRILAALSEHQAYVSELARELGISRPLLHMHLQALQKAGLVVGRHEVSAEGKALRYYEVTEFDERLTPRRITEAANSLSTESEPDGKVRK
jgi:predicted transcriptional regulator